MKITLKLFAAFREIIGEQELCLEIPEYTPIVQVYQKLQEKYPSLSGWEKQLRYARNLEFVEDSTILEPNDEIAFIPPVSGG